MQLIVKIPIAEGDAPAVERWLDEVLPTHPAIGSYSFDQEDDEIPDNVNRDRHGYWTIDNVDSAVGAELLCLHGGKATVARDGCPKGGYLLFDSSGKMLAHGMSALMLVGALDAFGVLPRSEHERAQS